MYSLSAFFSGADDPTVKAVNISVAFFSAERVRGFCQILIERYLILSAEELDTWRADPETYGRKARGYRGWIRMSSYF